MGTPEDANGSWIPAPAVIDNVVRMTAHRSGLMGQLMGSLDRIDPEKAAQVRNTEAFKAKSMINASVARLIQAAGPEVAGEFLREALATIQGSEIA